MKTSKLITLLSLLLLITYGFTCGISEEEEYNNIYDLELPLEIFPVQKVYRINDTITLAATIKDHRLKDLRTQNLIEISCTGIPIGINIGVRHADFNLQKDDDLFEIIVDTSNFPIYELENNGQISYFKSFIEESIIEKEQISVIKIVLKRKGVFRISPNGKAIFIHYDLDCNTFNPILDKGNMTHLFTVINNNPELLDQSPLPPNVFSSNDQTQKFTDEKRMYWFQVVD